MTAYVSPDAIGGMLTLALALTVMLFAARLRHR